MRLPVLSGCRRFRGAVEIQFNRLPVLHCPAMDVLQRTPWDGPTERNRARSSRPEGLPLAGRGPVDGRAVESGDAREGLELNGQADRRERVKNASMKTERAGPHEENRPGIIGRGGGIRTPDPLLPKQMRYQAALRPDTSIIPHSRIAEPRLGQPAHATGLRAIDAARVRPGRQFLRRELLPG